MNDALENNLSQIGCHSSVCGCGFNREKCNSYSRPPNVEYHEHDKRNDRKKDEGEHLHQGFGDFRHDGNLDLWSTRNINNADMAHRSQGSRTAKRICFSKQQVMRATRDARMTKIVKAALYPVVRSSSLTNIVEAPLVLFELGSAVKVIIMGIYTL